MTYKIRTTMTPGEVIVVSDSDYVDLQRQGVVAETVETPQGPVRTGRKAQSGPEGG